MVILFQVLVPCVTRYYSIRVIVKCIDMCLTNGGYICHWVTSFFGDVALVEFMYLEFARMPGESYRRQLRSLLLCWCDVLRAIINSLVFWFFLCVLQLMSLLVVILTAL